MLVIKFSKLYPSNFISHIDMLKNTNRVLSRAGFDIQYSQGYNPHQLIFFSPPCPVGVESLCEYLTIEMDNNENVVEKFNQASPEGIKALEVFKVNKNPNLAYEIAFADYSVKCNGIGELNLSEIEKNSKFEILYREKEVEKVKDYKDFIIGVTAVTKDEIRAKLKFGNENLRIDRFVLGLEQRFNTKFEEAKCLKTIVYNRDGKNIDELLIKATF